MDNDGRQELRYVLRREVAAVELERPLQKLIPALAVGFHHCRFNVDAALESGVENSAELAEARDRLEAEKLHLWIQQGRESFKRAYAIANSFVEKTEGNPEHPWYLRMRLQRNQLLISMGKGREVLTACIRDFVENPSAVTLHFYLSVLNELYRMVSRYWRQITPVS